MEPPSAVVGFGTVVCVGAVVKSAVVGVIGTSSNSHCGPFGSGEYLAGVGTERIACGSTVITHSDGIVHIGRIDGEYCVMSVGGIVLMIKELHPQLRCELLPAREAVHFVQAKPEFSMEAAEPFNVVNPVSLKVYRSVFPPLEHGPPSPISVHVTIHLEGLQIVGLYGVNSRLGESLGKSICTVLGIQACEFCEK